MKKVKAKFKLEVIGDLEETIELSYPYYYNIDEFLQEASLDWVYEKVKTSFEIVENDEFDKTLLKIYNCGILDEKEKLGFIGFNQKLEQTAYMLGRINHNINLSNEEILNKIYNY